MNKFGSYYDSDEKVILSELVVDYPGRGKHTREVLNRGGGKEIKTEVVCFCMDCLQRFPIFFKVKDEVWKEAGLGKGIICLNCFEKRMHRPMSIDDFHVGPIVNDPIFFGYRLARNTE